MTNGNSLEYVGKCGDVTRTRSASFTLLGRRRSRFSLARQLLLQIRDFLAHEVRLRRVFQLDLPIMQRPLQIALLLFEMDQVDEDLEIDPLFRLRVRILLFLPAAQSQLPKVARMGGIVPVFVIQFSQVEQNLITVRIGGQSFAQELFGLVYLVQAL